jgi:hypothetical protein
LLSDPRKHHGSSRSFGAAIAHSNWPRRLSFPAPVQKLVVRSGSVGDGNKQPLGCLVAGGKVLAHGIDLRLLERGAVGVGRSFVARYGSGMC